MQIPVTVTVMIEDEERCSAHCQFMGVRGKDLHCTLFGSNIDSKVRNWFVRLEKCKGSSWKMAEGQGELKY